MDKLKDLQKSIEQIDKNAQKIKNKMMYDYAISNAEFSVGDILQGNTFTILVDSIKWGSTRGYTSREINPYAVYYGKILTKKLLPRKDGDTASLNDFDDLIKLNNQ